MSTPQPIYHQHDYPLPFSTADLVSSALFASDQMKELDAHLLAVGETTGWADVVRERARQLMQSQPELSCKQLIDGVTAEIWAGWVEVPPVAKRCPLDVVSLGKRKRADSDSHSNEAKACINPKLLKLPDCGGDQVGTVADPNANGELSKSSVGLMVPDVVMKEGIEAVGEALDKIMQPSGPYVNIKLR